MNTILTNSACKVKKGFNVKAMLDPVKSSLPLNLGTNDLRCLPKHGSSQLHLLNIYLRLKMSFYSRWDISPGPKLH